MKKLKTVEIKNRFAEMWKKVRLDANVSQQYAAKIMGVSKTTIQNWEDGTSCPNQEKGFEYFEKLALSPLPYYLEVLYPEMFNNENLVTESVIKKSLHTLIDNLPEEICRKILYIAYGKHGSSPFGIVEMITAHLHTPLRDRLNVSQHIILNYKISKSLNTIICENNILPDLEMLELSTQKGIEAVMKKENSYSTIRKE